jgi:hypothetical protein
VYYGKTAEASRILSSAPHMSGRSFAFDNPGDFIIDILGLDNTEETNGDVSSTSSLSLNSIVPVQDRTTLLSEEFQRSQNFHDLQALLSTIFRAVEIIIPTTSQQRPQNVISNFFQALRRMLLSESTPHSYGLVNSDSVHNVVEIELTDRVNEGSHFETDSTLPELASEAQLSNTDIISSMQEKSNNCYLNHLLYRNTTRRNPLYRKSQVMVIFGRRTLAFSPSFQEFTSQLLQLIGVAVIVSLAFSYDISTDLEKPYQTLLLISLISLYAMILQYLLLTPEYMIERQTIVNDALAGNLSSSSYIFSVMLTEIPRAIMQSGLLLGILYWMHPLNPNAVKMQFSYICLMVGVTAWQALIAICSVLTDSIGVAYSIAFLVLSSGALFGGILVRLEKIPALFKIFYYISVTAVTQRALITNDLQCCYLTTTCNSIARGMQSMRSASILNHSNSTASYCPPGLEFTGDGSDVGNLGRLFLMVRGRWVVINVT